MNSEDFLVLFVATMPAKNNGIMVLTKDEIEAVTGKKFHYDIVDGDKLLFELEDAE